jgi:tRNASer (uridine44-2'-O)-methyltransferase
MPSKRNDPKGWEPVFFTNPGQDSDRSIRGRLKLPWEYVLCNQAPYSADIFSKVAVQLVFHPERNSKNILRADISYDSDVDSEYIHKSAAVPPEKLDNVVCYRTICRRLMPRNPNLDASLEQTCRFYIVDGDTDPTLCLYTGKFTENVPYYAPDVVGIGFELYDGKIWIAYLPFEGVDWREERLTRVATNLLRTMHRHWFVFKRSQSDM